MSIAPDFRLVRVHFLRASIRVVVTYSPSVRHCVVLTIRRPLLAAVKSCLVLIASSSRVS